MLCEQRLSDTKNLVTTATALARTEHHQLCQSEGLETFMRTDSQQLMSEGVATGAETFSQFLADAGWQRGEIDKTICHQVGVAHRKLLFESLDLDPRIDFATIEWLGNTGAAALPLTMALALEAKHILPDDRVALLGIGSGINCQMIGLHWRQSRVLGQLDGTSTETLPALSGAGP